MLKQLKGLILFFVLAANGFGQTLQIQKCWEYSEGNIISRISASDNTNSFLFFRSDENIFLDSINNFGEILWSNEVGGVPVSNILLTKDRVFILLKADQDLLIKTVSVETGLVIWQKKLETWTNKLSSNFQLLSSGSLLLLIDNKEKVLFFDAISGECLREIELSVASKTDFTVRNENILYISKENKLIEFNTTNYSEIVLYPFEKAIDQLYFSDENRVLLVDEFNNILCFDLNKKKVEWLIKLGGGVNSVSETSDAYQISSIDNYIYCVNKENGKFIWRKRTGGRSEGSLANIQKLYVSSIVNGQTTLFSELKKGKTINQIVLEEKEFFVGKPLIFGKQFILQTNLGFKSYSFIDCK